MGNESTDELGKSLNDRNTRFSADVICLPSIDARPPVMSCLLILFNSDRISKRTRIIVVRHTADTASTVFESLLICLGSDSFKLSVASTVGLRF